MPSYRLPERETSILVGSTRLFDDEIARRADRRSGVFTVDTGSANETVLKAAGAVLADQAAVSGGGRNNTAVVMSDSIGASGGVAVKTMSLFEYAALASNGALRVLNNFSVSGHKTSDLIAVQLPQALASEAGWVFVMEVTNDVFQGVSVAQHRANMRTIQAALSAAGKRTIFVAGPPINGWVTRVYNDAVAELAAELGEIFVNPWASVASNGRWRDTTWSLDGVHPYPKPSRISGSALWASIQPLFTGTANLAWSDEDGLLTNCLNLTNVSGVPTGWTGAAGITHSCAEAGTGEVAGNWWKQTATGITEWKVSSRSVGSLPTGWAVGDKVRMSARVRTVGVEANGGAGNTNAAAQGNMGAYISLAWANGTGGDMLLREVDADVEGYVSIDGVIPPGATGANLAVVITQQTTVSGEFSIAELQVHNRSLAARR